MKKCKIVHTTHVPSPQSAHGVTDLPELQGLRRLGFAAQAHHGRTGRWDGSSFTGKGQVWTASQTLLAEHTTQMHPRVEGATARLHLKLLHTSGSRRQLQPSRGSVRALRPLSKSPGHAHHFLLLLHPGVLPA